MTQYIHHIPGRLRIKHAGFKSDHEQLHELAACLESVPGVDNVTTNPVTGSVVMLYDASVLAPEELDCLLSDKGFCKSLNTAGRDVQLPGEVTTACKFLGRKAMGFAVERALKDTGFSFLAVLI